MKLNPFYYQTVAIIAGQIASAEMARTGKVTTITIAEDAVSIAEKIGVILMARVPPPGFEHDQEGNA